MPTIVCISDTHNLHNFLSVPEGNILLHAGDFSLRGRESETISFLKWYEAQPHEHKIFTCGNHECGCEANHSLFLQLIKEHAPSCHYLNDSGMEIMGLKIWGSPVTPRFGYGWSWNRDRGADIQRHWNMIPEDTNVLITHGPPHGIVDKLEYGEHAGCENLRKTIDEKLDNLLLTCHGHLHSAYGRETIGPKTFVNAAVVNEDYVLTNLPIVVEL